MRPRDGRTDPSLPRSYRGRLAPTPTGDMHVGHARTFVAAWRRAVEAGGEVVLRIEDLDPLRCRAEYSERAIEDLEWLGVRWSEGPVYQSRRCEVYEGAWRALRDVGVIYPSTVSRRAGSWMPHQGALMPSRSARASGPTSRCVRGEDEMLQLASVE